MNNLNSRLLIILTFVKSDGIYVYLTLKDENNLKNTKLKKYKNYKTKFKKIRIK
jgi:hypothetical protein